MMKIECLASTTARMELGLLWLDMRCCGPPERLNIQQSVKGAAR